MSTDFHEILYLRIVPKPVEKFQVSLQSDILTTTLHEDLCTFIITSC